VAVECFRYGEKGHKCKGCSLRKEEKRRQKEKKVACMAMPQKVQQMKWKRSPAHVLQWKAQEHCRVGISDKAYLLELGWYTKEVVVLYLVYKEYRKQGCHVEENRGQGVISRRQLEKLR